jgi:hypothetical protein
MELERRIWKKYGEQRGVRRRREEECEDCPQTYYGKPLL